MINISSYTASKGGGEMVVYTIAKTALVGFTRAQALEWAPYTIQVNAIAHGIFPDPVTSSADRARQTAERTAHIVPLDALEDSRKWAAWRSIWPRQPRIT
jgi:NAD(P)-dependent dehydrogenase (short-subunit alcohol dehydrogenase family)